MDERLPSQGGEPTQQPQYSQPQGVQPPPPSYAPAPSPGNKFSLILRAVLGLLVLGIIIVGALIAVPLFMPKSVENVTLTYWGLWEDESVMRPIFEEFKKQHPNISVAYSRQDPEQYQDRLNTRMQIGTGPDIFRYHNSWTTMLSPILLPIPSDVIPGSEITKSYYPVVAQDVIRNGGVLGVPLQIDTLSLFINTEIFKAAGVTPPQNWDDFIRLSRQLTVKDESDRIRTSGAAMGTFGNITNQSDIVSLLFIQNGVQTKALGDAPEKAAEALDFYTAFAKSEKVWDTTLEQSLLAFANGNLAMYFGYARDIPTIKSKNPSLQFEVYPVPNLPGRKTTIASYWVEGISAKSAHPKEAALLLRYLSQKETMQRIHAEQIKARQFGDIYPRPDMVNLLKTIQYANVFFNQAPFAVSTPFSSETHDTGVNKESNDNLAKAVQQALTGNSKAAVEDLVAAQAQVVGRYGQ